MDFMDLSEAQKIHCRARIQELLKGAARSAPERWAAANAQRLAAGRAAMTNDQVATLLVWPPWPTANLWGQIDAHQETFFDPHGRGWVLSKGLGANFMDAWAQWIAMDEALKILTNCGLSDQWAFSALPDLGFHFSYGVVGVVVDPEGSYMLVGVRAGGVNHSGRLSLPGGFVQPGESLKTAVLREVKEEARLKSSVWVGRGGVCFGPHDKAPSATFVLGLSSLEFGQSAKVAANEEWEHGLLVVTPAAEVALALAGSLAPITERFVRHGLNVTAGFAPDVAGPLRRFLSV